MANRRVLVLALMATALIGLIYYTQARVRTDRLSAPPQKIKIRLGESVKDFIRVNGAPSNYGGQPIDFDRIQDEYLPPLWFQDKWIQLVYEDPKYGFELPAGKTLTIRQTLGTIEHFQFTPFADAMPFEETDARVRQIIDMLLDIGWRPRGKLHLPKDENDEETRKARNIYAQLKNDDGNELEITVLNLAAFPYVSTSVLEKDAQMGRTRIARYMIEVGLYRKSDLTRDTYRDLLYPRRLFVNGDRKKPLSLRVWVDDPDWTPKRAGMIKRGTDWSMPQKGE